MKKCPNCNQVFTDDDLFCLNDGASLIFVSGIDSDQSFFPTSGEIPTQYIPHPSIPAKSNDHSKWLYIMIGVLATVFVLVIAVYFSSVGNQTENKNSISSNTGKSNNTSDVVTQPAAVVTQPAAQNSVKPENTANSSPKGKWTGNLSYPWGAAYSAKADLMDNGNGQINGQVVWTCTANPKNADEIGTIDIEIVKGTFDSSTRMLSLKENTNNPKDVGSRYMLTLAEKSGQLKGYIFGKRKRWNLDLQRF